MRDRQRSFRPAACLVETEVPLHQEVQEALRCSVDLVGGFGGALAVQYRPVQRQPNIMGC